MAAFSLEAHAARTITFPHTEAFTSSSSLSDITWVVQGATASRVASSWRGGGNYCAKLTPPTSADGINGTYSCLGEFYFSDTNNLNISFAMYVGTTYHTTAVNAGGGRGNKFLDVHLDTARTGILHLYIGEYDYTVFGLWQMPSTAIYTYDGSTTDGIQNFGASANQYRFYNGSSHARDLAGEWIWVNYILTTSSQKIYLYTRDGTRSGLYFEISSTASGGHDRFYVGGYYNHYHPSADANTFIMLDDLVITNSSTPQTVPTGFVEGEDTTPPTLQSATIGRSGTTLTLAFDETVSIGAGGNGGVSLSMSGGTVTATYSSGSGSNSLVYSLSRTVYSGETGTAAYTQPGNGIEDAAGNDLATFSGESVANDGPEEQTAANMTPVRQTGGVGVVRVSGGLVLQ